MQSWITELENELSQTDDLIQDKLEQQANEYEERLNELSSQELTWKQEMDEFVQSMID